MTTVLITGANSGIGYALLQHYLDQGDRVIALDRCIDRLSQPGVDAVQLDLSDTAALAQWCAQRDHGVEVLINCAGIREITPVLDLDVSEWQRVMAVNLTAPFVLSQAMAKAAVAASRPLAIINIASISGIAVEPNRAAYCSSKHGVVGLTKQMAMDLAPHNIRVNAVAPGVVETELTQAYFEDPDQVALIKANTPLARWAQTSHVVQAVDGLIANDMMTGHVLVVDGGWTLGKQL